MCFMILLFLYVIVQVTARSGENIRASLVESWFILRRNPMARKVMRESC